MIFLKMNLNVNKVVDVYDASLLKDVCGAMSLALSTKLELFYLCILLTRMYFLDSGF